MKVWITKYALTCGIETGITDGPPSGSTQLVKVNNQFFHGEGRDWHQSLESAIIRAEQMRVRKIASLKKAIENLESLAFQSQGRHDPL